MVGATALFGRTDIEELDLDAVEKPIETQEDQVPVEEEIIESLFDINDFNKTNLTTVITKYGVPTSQVESTLPVFSHVEWDNKQYNIYLDYKKGENYLYGGLFTLKQIPCGIGQLNMDIVKTVSNSVKLDFDGGDWRKSGQHYSSGSYDGWDSITVKCNTSGKVYLNAMGKGYMDWASE